MRIYYLFVLLFVLFWHSPAPADIVQTEQVSEIAAVIDSDSLVFFDVDDTLIQPAVQLGSSAWRKHLKTILGKVDAIRDGNKIPEAFAHASFMISQRVPIKSVDSELPQLISHLQNEKIPVFAFTARGMEWRWQVSIA